MTHLQRLLGAVYEVLELKLAVEVGSNYELYGDPIF